jgi:poly(hydroxyalkanoate) depolymerase family esterase
MVVPLLFAALTDVASFGANPAQLTMKKHVPATVPAGPRPLVVALHGCTQTAEAYESAGWSALADQWGFYVVYPGQNTAKNNSSGCFNWGGRWKSAPQAFVISPEALIEDDTEHQSIRQMVDKMKADHAIDGSRVFVTGLSAGGAMVSLLLARSPDVFSAGAIFAGVPYGCATDKKTTTEAAACLKDYSGANAYLSRSPKAWGDLVRGAAPSFKGTWPRVQIWHGTADFIVDDANQNELVKQWTDVNGADQTPDVSDSIENYPHALYKDASGKVVVETFTMTGKSHGTEVAASKPIDPANASGAKCGKAGSYIIEAGICSTYHAARFFGLDPSAPNAPNAPNGPNGSTSSSSGDADGDGIPDADDADDTDGPTGGANGAGKAGKVDDRQYGSTCSAQRVSSSSAGGFAVIALAIATIWARRRPARPRASGVGSGKPS